MPHAVEPSTSPLAATPLSEVIEALADLGVVVSERAFLDVASRAVTASEVADTWLAAASVAPGDDEELVREAAVDLWRRWLPERPCAELLAPGVAQLLTRSRADIHTADLAALLGALDRAGQRSRALGDALSSLLGTDVGYWLGDLFASFHGDSPAKRIVETLLADARRTSSVPTPRADESRESTPALGETPTREVTASNAPTEAEPGAPTAFVGLSPEDAQDDDDSATLQGVGRNEPCPCGSGRKYKRCHLGKPLPPPTAAS